ncbi:TPA: C/D box methylation guide ribonucleoprotein complex aNOP56 subunit, partial [Candidatus Woesearchaeota archaeon]|nr:C/D box methylation guide ribonucleoprotein complex aNOP56 subunit [Candidatus Woesearchaeota archaeon]
EKMALMPASTIQLLGAEKALFRHMTTGAKPPKFGVIINHPLVTKAKKPDKGKVARTMADKISLAAKIDFFKGEFKGDDLRKELEERFK